MTDKIYDVLILGFGPVGATLANLLGQAGHDVAVAEIHPEVFDKPRAVNIDQEGLRLWQRIGLAKEIAAECEPHPGTDFIGMDGKLIKYIYSAPPPFPLGWPANLMFVQPVTERILRKGVKRFANVTVHLKHTAFRFAQAEDYVTVTFATPGGERTIRARWLVGCDGANSPTRQWLGIGQEDLGFSEHWVVVDAWLKRDTPLPERTTQYCWPSKPSAYVVCSGTLRRWEMKILPEEDPADYASLDKVKERMRPFVDPEALEFWRTAVYLFHARVTDRWREGRVFLAGDSAHQMPPFLGQGLCSGLRDVANLWWKLDRVLRGTSSAGLLDSYQAERKPHIRVLTEITKELGVIVGETDPEKAQARDRYLREEMHSGRMVTVRQNLIPALADGFLDRSDASGLAGALAVQPRLKASEGTCLSDELSEGMTVLTVGKAPEGLADMMSSVDGTVLEIGTGRLSDPEGLFTQLMQAKGLTALFVRPDGVVWSGQNGPQATCAAADRLPVALIR